MHVYKENVFYFEQFLNLRQGKSTMDEYSDKSPKLQEVCRLDENGEHGLKSFLKEDQVYG